MRKKLFSDEQEEPEIYMQHILVSGPSATSWL